MAVRSKPGICLGNSDEEELEGAVWATERTAASSIEGTKIIRIRIMTSQRKKCHAAANHRGRNAEGGNARVRWRREIAITPQETLLQEVAYSEVDFLWVTG